MGNKWPRIFKYNNYIVNIEILSYEEDLDIYNDVINHSSYGNFLRNNGIMETYPILKTIDVLKKRFTELNLTKKDFQIYIEGLNLELKKYIPIIKNLGYNISVLPNDGSNFDERYDENNVYSSICLTPKYDLKVYPVPDVLYYTAPFKLKNKISKIGFMPLIEDKKHPNKIYLTDSIENAIENGENMNEKYCVYEINGSNTDLYTNISNNNGFFIKWRYYSEKFKIIIEK